MSEISSEQIIKELRERIKALEIKAFGYSKEDRVAAQAAREVLARSAVRSSASETRNSQAVHLAQSRPLGNSETSSTGSFLGIVGIICFLLAAAFLVNLAISSGWLTPIRQWGLVTLFGATLIGIGFTLAQNDSDYAGRAAAGGLVVLYFSAYSSHLIFNLFSQEVALGVAIGVSFIGLGLARVFQSEVFSVTAVLGTYISPLLLGFNQMSFEILSGYFLIWTSVFSLISVFLQSRATTILAAYGGIGIFALINFIEAPGSNLPTVVFVQIVQFLILLIGAVAYSIKRESSMSTQEASAFLAPLLFFYGTEYYFLSKWVGDWAPWISLGFAAVLLVAYFVARKKLDEGGELASGSMVGSFVAVVLFHAGYLEILPEPMKPYLLLIGIVGILFLRSDSKNISAGWMGPAIALILIGLLEYGKVLIGLATGPEPGTLQIGLLATFLMLSVYLGGGNSRLRSAAGLFLPATHLIAILSLYRVAQSHGSFGVSISWSLYAVLVLGLAFARRDWNFAKSSVMVLLLAAGKALLYDVSNAGGSVRVVCLLLTGALLYGAGFLFRVIARNERA